MTEIRNIGIFGGTFDPIHNGHLMIAEAALRECRLDEVIFIPAGRPPFKDNRPGLASGKKRLRMVRLAISGNPHFSVSDLEIRSREISYTYVTLEKLRDLYPGSELYFIVGEDSLYSLDQWKCPERITSAARIVCARRAGEYDSAGTRKDKDLKTQCAILKATLGADIRILSTPYIDLSSTDIRNRILGGYGARYLVPDAVWHYILQNRTYSGRGTEETDGSGQEHPCGLSTILPEAGPEADGPGTGAPYRLFDIPEEFPRIEKALRSVLPEARMRHTEGVCYTAAALAMAHGENVGRAALAGLLHDCAKRMTEEELLEYCKKREIPVSVYEEKSPKLLHAKAGSSLAEEQYGINDREILSAIRYHTTGRSDMTLLEKIVYVADAIEPNRTKMTGLPVYRYLAFTDLDMCVYRIMADTLEYLRMRKKNIDKTTKEAYDFYKELIQRRPD